MRNKLFLIGIVVFIMFVSVIVLSYRDNITPSDFIQIILLTVLVIVTAFYANSASRQASDTRNLVDETKKSLSQAARASMDGVMIEHNWKLFENETDPGLPGLPSMSTNKEYWRWRMVHLDHVNLLHTRWVDYKDGAITDEEIKGLIGWAQLLLEELQNDRQEAINNWTSEGHTSEPTTADIMEFEKTSPRLKALLHISELHNWDLFPCNFVQWLRYQCNFRSLGLSEKNSGERSNSASPK